MFGRRLFAASLFAPRLFASGADALPPPVDPTGPEHYTLTIFDDDDVTPLFSVSTDPEHERPYLTLQPFSPSEIDLLNGTAHIGFGSASVIDPQTGETQDVRDITALLGTTDGYSAVNRRRFELRTDPGNDVVMNGIVSGVSLNASRAGFTFSFADIRDRGVEVPAFNRTTTSTILPRGVLDGYGLLPNGEWLVPPVTPLRATWNEDSVFGLYVSGAFALAGRTTQAGGRADPALVLTDAQRDTMTVGGAQFLAPAGTYDRVTILWRPAAGGAWTEITGIAAAFTPRAGEVGLFQTIEAKVGDATVTAITAVRANNVTGSTLPADGASVDIIVRYTGEPSEKYPLHIEGPWGDVAEALLSGEYSYRPDGTTIDPRLHFDAAAFLAIDTPIRARITKPLDDVRVALEQMCKPIGAAPAIDRDGLITPVRYQIPPVDAELPEISATNCTPIAGWEHPTSNAITAAEVTYYRDYRVSAEQDPEGRVSGGDGLGSRPVTHRHLAPQAVRDVMGEQDVHKVDAWMFRALGGTDGQPASGDVMDETGAQLAIAIARQSVDRRGYGGPAGFVRLMASELPDLALGDWLLDARPWVPNYAAGTRGANALVQVVSLQPGGEWFDVALDYAAPYDNPLAAPTAAAPTADDDGVVSVDVLTVPAGAAVEVQYATGTPPAADSGLWLPGGDPVEGTGERTLPAQPVDTDVTVRIRSIAVGRRPSSWVVLDPVTTPAPARLLSLTLGFDSEGAPVARWTANPFALGVRLYYESHASSAEPGLATYVDVDASDGSYTFPPYIVSTKQWFTVEAEPWTGWTDPDVSGTAGARVRRSVGDIVRPVIVHASIDFTSPSNILGPNLLVVTAQGDNNTRTEGISIIGQFYDPRGPSGYTDSDSLTLDADFFTVAEDATSGTHTVLWYTFAPPDPFDGGFITEPYTVLVHLRAIGDGGVLGVPITIPVIRNPRPLDESGGLDEQATDVQRFIVKREFHHEGDFFKVLNGTGAGVQDTPDVPAYTASPAPDDDPHGGVTLGIDNSVGGNAYVPVGDFNALANSVPHIDAHNAMNFRVNAQAAAIEALTIAVADLTEKIKTVGFFADP
jgi:hypothetical protein